MSNFIFSLSLVLLFLDSLKSFAATNLNSQCTKNSAHVQVQGLNINTPYTIASVTKVFTTHWAINRLGPKYRFPSIIHIAPVGKNLYDVHIEGALFPYFDKTMYQFLVGELNKLGVYHINYLTYDEHFIYATNVRTNTSLAHGNNDPDIIEIMNDLRIDTITLNTGLAALNAKALAVEKLQLPNILSLRINDIHFLRTSDFVPTPSTTSFKLHSTELHRNLKEMNRNSNNFVADKIFIKLSEKETHRDFILKNLPAVKPDEITLYNGSGYPVISNLDKIYNEASCAAVLEMMADLRQSLQYNGLDSKDILPVAGKDSTADGDSSVTKIYANEQTIGTLIAKTGSVVNTIALAGLIITANENIFFQTSYNVDANPEDRAWAYAKIKSWLSDELIKDQQKSDLDSYQPKTFLPFDSVSRLQKIANINQLN